MGWRRWPRGRVALVAVVTVVAVGAIAAALLWPRDTTRVVPVEEAVDNYRAATIPVETSAPGTSPPGTTGAETLALVAPGVYRYATSGWEDIDALNGARHDYPAETTITVTTEGCGVRLRWEALRERRDEWRLCVTERGIEFQPDAIQYHEFFEQPELEHLACDRAVVVVPSGEAPSDSEVQSCRLADDPWVATWTVLERTTLPVGDTEVPVWHVRMTVDDNDDHWEHTTTDWFLDDHGLPVAVTSTKESNSPSPIGDVRYRETYELSVDSLTPLR